MTRIVIADDHAIVREGLKRILADTEFTLMAEAGSSDEVLRLVGETDFEVLTLDLTMPGRSGMELIRAVKALRPQLKILVVSMHQDSEYAVRAIRSGANGYMAKDSAASELPLALRKVAAGGAYISAEVAEQLALSAMPGHAAEPHQMLTPREFEIFRLLVAGVPVSEIAARLHLSVKTISTHKANLLQKLGVQNENELLRYAIRHGLDDRAAGLPGG